MGSESRKGINQQIFITQTAVDSRNEKLSMSVLYVLSVLLAASQVISLSDNPISQPLWPQTLVKNATTTVKLTTMPIYFWSIGLTKVFIKSKKCYPILI